MTTPALVILFFFGLAVGSFLNVVSFRYTPGDRILFTKKIGGRSHCRNCKTTLRWYELVPLLSFVIQGFKCRHCEHALSWQYPGIEFLTGFLTAAIPHFFFGFFQVKSLVGLTENQVWFYLFVLLWLLVTYACITLSIIDLRYQIIPDQINLFLLILGSATFLIKLGNPNIFRYNGSFIKNYISVLSVSSSLWQNLGLAVLLAVLFFGGIIFFTKGKGMGMGDLKLAIPLAVLLGWPDILLAFSAAFVIGSVVGISMMARKKKGLKDMVPFGPFMVLGLYTVVFYGESLLQWYFSLV